MANMSERFNQFSPDDDNLTLEELVALIQQAPDDWFTGGSLSVTGPSAQELMHQGHEHLKAYQSNPSPEALKTAIANYRQAVELDPNLAEGYTHLAKALWHEGNISLENALHYCELAIQNDPGNPAHYLATSQFLAEAGEYHHVHRVINLAKITATGAKRHDLLSTIHWRGFMYGMQGFSHAMHTMPIGKAFYYYSLQTVRHAAFTIAYLPSQWLKHGLTNPEKTLSLATQINDAPTPFTNPGRTIGEDINDTSVDTSAHTHSSAKSWLTQTITHASSMLPNPKTRQKVLHWAHRNHPEHRPTLEALAHSYEANQQFGDALACFEHLSLLYPNHAEYHARYGILLGKQGKPHRAVDELEQALSIQPGRFEWLFEMGQLQLDSQDYLAALVSFKEAQKQHPHHPLILSNMAYALFKVNDMEGAIHCYEEALIHGSDPQWKSAVAQTLGALLYQYEDDTDGALDAFYLALKLDATNTDARTMMAELQFELGDFEQALIHYQWLHERDPGNVDTLSHMGYILWQMDKNEDAITAYKAAIALDPQNAIIYNNMGVVVLDELMDGAESAPMFENALKYYPQYTLAAFNLGRALEMTGELKAAAEAYGNALNLYELNPEMDKADIEERLHNLFRV